MTTPLKHVIDAIDMETFLACDSEEEGRRLAVQILQDIGFKDINLVFCEFIGLGVRVRIRASLHRPGDYYPWLAGSRKNKEGGGSE